MSETMTDDRQVEPSSPQPTGGEEPALHRHQAWKRRRAAVRGFSVITVLAIVGLGWLGVEGYQAARKIKGGATATIITDPNAPGYVAAVDASPVHLVAVTDDADALSAFLVFVPDPAGGGGSIIWSLGELVVEVDGAQTALTDLYKSQGFDAARAEFEKALGFGSTDATIAGPDDFAALGATTGPVTLKNPDTVSVEVKGKRTERFKAGTIEVEPEDFGEFLTIRGAGEDAENRSTRAEALLAALAKGLNAPADGSPSTGATSAAGGATTSVPATAEDIDLGTILTEMGATPAEFVLLPTTRQSFKGAYLYSPDPETIGTTLDGIVQFPVSAFPGQRPRVRILNGTTDTSVANGVAPELARLGGEVLLIGNAKTLDVGTTSVVYSNDAFKEVADRVAEAVGVSAERTDDLSDAADIDVVLGADYQP